MLCFSHADMGGDHHPPARDRDKGAGTQSLRYSLWCEPVIAAVLAETELWASKGQACLAQEACTLWGPDASSRSATLTIFRMAALEWLAAVEMSSKDPVAGGRRRVRLQGTRGHHQGLPCSHPSLWMSGAAPSLGQAGVEPCRHTVFGGEGGVCWGWHPTSQELPPWPHKALPAA